jgi:Domain of unknown function (DUF1902)
LKVIDRRDDVPDVLAMRHPITINVRWDPEASVWIATSDDVPGLVVEGDTLTSLEDEVRLVLPDLIELSDQKAT